MILLLLLLEDWSDDQLRADLNDAVLSDQESGDVGDPLMACGVPSPQPEDHCFPDI